MAQYGYFTDGYQTKPTFDPGLDVPCPSCGDTLSQPVKTISLMLDGDSRSYFYRTHKACYDPLNDEQRGNLDGLIIDAIAASKQSN